MRAPATRPGHPPRGGAGAPFPSSARPRCARRRPRCLRCPRRTRSRRPRRCGPAAAVRPPPGAGRRRARDGGPAARRSRATRVRRTASSGMSTVRDRWWRRPGRRSCGPRGAASSPSQAPAPPRVGTEGQADASGRPATSHRRATVPPPSSARLRTGMITPSASTAAADPRDRAPRVPGVEHHRERRAGARRPPGQLGRLGRADVGDERVAHPVTPLVGHRVAGGIVGAPAPPVVGHPGAAQDGEAERGPQRVVAAARPRRCRRGPSRHRRPRGRPNGPWAPRDPSRGVPTDP